MEIDPKELTVIRQKVSTLESRSEAVQIENEQDYRNTADLIAMVKETGKLLNEKKESITKPLNDALKAARELFKPIEEQYANAESILKGKLLAYKRKVDDAARAAEAKIAADLEAGKIKKIETAERKLEQITRVDNTTSGKKGTVQIRKIKKVRIVDVSLIPREYMTPNEVMIRRDALAGKPIAGVEVYEEESVSSSSW